MVNLEEFQNRLKKFIFNNFLIYIANNCMFNDFRIIEIIRFCSKLIINLYAYMRLKLHVIKMLEADKLYYYWYWNFRRGK